VARLVECDLKKDRTVSLLKATLAAVSEVGNPTILATFTVIAAILPMAFVRGLMGPYMKPIPVGASLAMIFSLVVAFVVTPWAAVRLLKHTHTDSPQKTPTEGRLDRTYRRAMSFLLHRKRNSLAFGGVIAVLFVAAAALVYFKSVKVKMLPFDNKNEFQILVDYPTPTPLRVSLERSQELAQQLLENKEVRKIQVFAGESAPFSFSGMVKHTFLRRQDYLTDLQIVLTDKSDRSLSSHQVIESLRPTIAAFGRKWGAVTKVLEIPPGPPVLATVVAEIYGPTPVSRRKATQEVQQVIV
jgi:multidrug efflux pump subunit AcrB